MAFISTTKLLLSFTLISALFMFTAVFTQSTYIHFFSLSFLVLTFYLLQTYKPRPQFLSCCFNTAHIYSSRVFWPYNNAPDNKPKAEITVNSTQCKYTYHDTGKLPR